MFVMVGQRQIVEFLKERCRQQEEAIPEKCCELLRLSKDLCTAADTDIISSQIPDIRFFKCQVRMGAGWRTQFLPLRS
jgi:hypothetical protein